MTILIAVLTLGGLYLLYRLLRSIPWAATIRILIGLLFALALISAAIHLDINPYTLLDAALPDFGANP